jgi:catechol 2,3-dioxygenase-like lactoylglutathione lyase family enzyme
VRVVVVPPPESFVQDVAAGTITVAAQRLEHVIDVYRRVLGLRVAWFGDLPSTVAEGWALDARPRRAVVLAAPDQTRGMIRLVAGETPPPPALATYGWSALELTVRDADALFERVLQSPDFRVNGEPHDLVFTSAPPGQRAFQAVGPAGEQLFLTQILRQTPGRELAVPPAGAQVGPVFIVVLAARNYAAVRSFYADLLRMNPYIELENGLSFAARVAGWPEGSSGRLMALKPRGDSRIEVDGYPAVALERKQVPGELAPGIGLASLSVADLDATLEVLSAAGHAALAAPARLETPPYAGRRAATVRGGDGELVELIGD